MYSMKEMNHVNNHVPKFQLLSVEQPTLIRERSPLGIGSEQNPVRKSPITVAADICSDEHPPNTPAKLPCIQASRCTNLQEMAIQTPEAWRW